MGMKADFFCPKCENDDTFDFTHKNNKIICNCCGTVFTYEEGKINPEDINLVNGAEIRYHGRTGIIKGEIEDSWVDVYFSDIDEIEEIEVSEIIKQNL